MLIMRSVACHIFKKNHCWHILLVETRGQQKKALQKQLSGVEHTCLAILLLVSHLDKPLGDYIETITWHKCKTDRQNSS